MLDGQYPQMELAAECEPTKPAIPVEQVAEMCHEANRIYCGLIGDAEQPPWEGAPDWQKKSAINGVQVVIDSYHCLGAKGKDQDQHDAWMYEKLMDGWKYGPVKNADTKEHPCLLPYDKLPDEQKRKDVLFRMVVEAFLKKV